MIFILVKMRTVMLLKWKDFQNHLGKMHVSGLTVHQAAALESPCLDHSISNSNTDKVIIKYWDLLGRLFHAM